MQGNAAEGSATLDVDPGLTNDGTILLESQNSTYNDTLSTGSGTFTNDADGIIQVTAGTGGSRTISGTVINSGTINFDTNTTFGATGANLVNTGLMSIAGATVTVVGSTFTNDAGGLVSGYGTFTTSGVTLNDTGGTIQARRRDAQPHEFRLRLQWHARRRYVARGTRQHADHQRRLVDLHPLGECRRSRAPERPSPASPACRRSLPAASSSSRTMP